MGFQLSPGVNVSEIDLTTVVPSVLTTSGAFAGYFRWGPIDKVVLVDSEITLSKIFGKPDANSATSFFTASNFLSYGNNLSVVRSVGANSENSVINLSSPPLKIDNSDVFELSFLHTNTLGAYGPFIGRYPGDLGNSLSVYACDAGGDFSNYQLVNSVGGMATQLTKDPYIMNAVSSTKLYRKSLEEMETARKEGKSSSSNEWDFRDQASKWLNSNDLNTSFSGTYRPYTNWRKNAVEVIRALTKDSTITEDAFSTDDKGNITIYDAKTRAKLAGISPEKIQQALLSGLSPDDWNQMSIDGRYNYSNVSPEQFVADVNGSYSDKVNSYLKQIKTLDAAKSQTQSTVEKAKLDNQIVSLNKAIESIKSEYASISRTFTSGDVESAKARLQTANNINGFSRAFSFTETEQTYEVNPYVQPQQFRETKEIEWLKWKTDFDEKKRQFGLSYDLDLRKTEAAEKAAGVKAGGLGGGLPEGREKGEIANYTVDKLAAKVEQDDQAIKTNEAAFLAQQGKDAVWLADQKLAWERNPNGVDPMVAQYFRNNFELIRKNESNKQLILNVDKQVTAEKGSIEDLIPKGSPTVNYRSASGSYSFEPKDFVYLNSKFDKYRKVEFTTVGGSSSRQVRYDDETAKQELSPKEFLLYQTKKKAFDSPATLTQAERALVDNLNFYNTNVNTKYNKTIGERMERTSEILAERLGASQAVSYDIPTTTPAQRDDFGSLLAKYAKRADEQGGIANSPDFNADTARKLAVDEKLIGNIRVVEGTEIEPAMYEVTATGKDGTITFRMTPEEKKAKYGGDFDSSPAVKAAKPYLEQIRRTGGYSTAIAPGPSSHLNSFLSAPDFPNVKTYGVTANIVTPDNGSTYSVRLSIYDPINRVWRDDIPYPRTGLIVEKGITAALLGLDDSAVYELLYDKPATAADLKVVQEASKKPL